MKKIATILLLTFSFISFAQPIIEGTYLPVRGSSIKEIWDITSTLTVPDSGANIFWDYCTQFTAQTDTFQIKTFHPDSIVNGHSYSQYFPNATHASFLRSPLNNLSDSLYSYYIIDADGLHMLGGFNIRAQTANNVGYDTTAIMNPSELMTPSIVGYGDIKYDTSKYVTYGRWNGNSIKISGRKYKKMIGYSYGTLKMPNGSIFNNVLLARQNIHTIDSVFLAGSNYFLTVQNSDFIDYSFLRNNTFGSSYLMYLNVNAANNFVNYGWYALPVDFGSISGTVYDSLGVTVTNGEALLYRENSNFAKNDILDRAPLDGSGNYQFDSIPYGEYRVAIRADSIAYPNTFTTYYGDTSNWLDATPIITTTNSAGNNIILQYHSAPPTDGGEINGFIGLDLNVVRLSDPIPGIDIVVRKNPGGIAVQEVTTNSSGNFTLQKLPLLVAPFTNYSLFVDIPGLHMAGTYSDIIVISGTVIIGLDFTVGTDSIHPNSSYVGIKEQYKGDNLLGAYPNPYSSNTIIKINLPEKCDVLLEVYNLLGEKIKTLDNSQKVSGSYSYNFNAKGLNFPAGIYVVKLSAGDRTSVLKIIEQ